MLKAELGVIETPESDVAETAEWSEERDIILYRPVNQAEAMRLAAKARGAANNLLRR